MFSPLGSKVSADQLRWSVQRAKSSLIADVSGFQGFKVCYISLQSNTHTAMMQFRLLMITILVVAFTVRAGPSSPRQGSSFPDLSCPLCSALLTIL